MPKQFTSFPTYNSRYLRSRNPELWNVEYYRILKLQNNEKTTFLKSINCFIYFFINSGKCLLTDLQMFRLNVFRKKKIVEH